MSDQPISTRLAYRKIDLQNGKEEVWLDRDGPNVVLHAGGSSSWKCCETEGCNGDAVARDSKCFLHTSDDAKKQYLALVLKRKSCLSFRGVKVNQELIEALMNSPVVMEKTFLVPITFAGAEIEGEFDLEGYTFNRFLVLNGAVIRNYISFDRTTFKEQFLAHHLRIGLPPSFNGTTFFDEVDFSYAEAGIGGGTLQFSNSTFHRAVFANGMVGPLWLERCKFEGDLFMQGANASIINIKNCSVAGELDLKDMHCAAFRSNHLQAVGTHQIGPITVENDCSFSNATFGARVQLEVRAKSLNLSGAQFREGGYIKAEEARIYLSHVNTGRHLRIAGGMIKSEEPVIMSLQDADAGSMSFAHVDMSRCIFYGSHDLGEIVINASAQFALTPPGHLKRRCIADEFAWRLHTKASKSTKWNLLGTEVVGDFQAQNEHKDIVPLPPLQASQVADVYRDLRRSFEGKGNGPGAADFYYGEMEMRRHDPDRPLSERLILFFYWILSGYGLRASFAILWLIPLLIVGGILMSAFGFQNNCQPFVDGFVFTLRSIFPGLSHSIDLTLIGKVIEMGTKVLGTMLLALAVLAIRARVKR